MFLSRTAVLALLGAMILAPAQAGAERPSVVRGDDSSACFAAPTADCLLDAAVDLRIRIEDRQDWTITTAAIAIALAQAGRADDGLALAEAVANIDPMQFAFAQAGIAGVLADRGDIAGAEDILHNIETGYDADAALARIAAAQAAAGEIDTAFAVANQLAFDELRDPLIRAIAVALVTANRDREAVELIGVVRGAAAQAATMAAIGRALLEANPATGERLFRQAQEATAQVVDPAQRAHAAAPVAEELAAVGYIVEALDVLDGARNAADAAGLQPGSDYAGDSIALVLAPAFAAAGNTADAFALAAAIDSDELAVAAWTEIARRQEAGGDAGGAAQSLRDALEIARDIAFPGARARAIATVGAALARIG